MPDRSSPVARPRTEGSTEIRQLKGALFASMVVNGMTPFALYLMLAVPGDGREEPAVAALGELLVLGVVYLFVKQSGREKVAYVAGLGCMLTYLLAWSVWHSPSKYFWGFPALVVIVFLRLTRYLAAASISSEHRRSLKMDCVAVCGCLPMMWLAENGQVAFPHTVIFVAVVGLMLRLYTLWSAERMESSTHGKGFGAAPLLLVTLGVAFGVYGTRLVVDGFIAVVYVFFFLLSPFLFLLPGNYHFVLHRKATDPDPTQGGTPGQLVTTNPHIPEAIVVLMVVLMIVAAAYFLFLLVQRGRRSTHTRSSPMVMALLAVTYLGMLWISPVLYRLRTAAQTAINLYAKGDSTASATESVRTQGSTPRQPGLHTVYIWASIVLLLTMVGLVTYLLWMRRRTFPDELEANQPSAVRRRWLQSELNGIRLRQTTDPVRLKYQEWLKSRHKIGQTMMPYETARQFEQRLRHLGSGTGDWSRLRQEYEAVRYVRSDTNREGEQI